MYCRDRIVEIGRALALAADAATDGRETWMDLGPGGVLYRWSESAALLVAVAAVEPGTLARVFEVTP